MRLISRYLLLLLLISFASCDTDDGFSEPDGDTTFGIRHDRDLADYEDIAADSNPELPDFSPVVAFEYSVDGSQNGDFTASGVLITPEWILTAGHNFYDVEEQNAPAPPSGITVFVGNDPNNPDETFSVAEVVLHPTWENGLQVYENANDLCLVRLSSPITSITPASLYSETDEVVGSTAWHAGFGSYSEQDGQNPNLESKKHAMENVLDRVRGGIQTSAGGTTYPGGLLAFDFDHPDGTVNALGDELVNDDEATLGSGTSSPMALNFEGTTVTGDSGGPLFLNNNGTWRVAGILSGGAFEPIQNHRDGDYGDISIYIRVSTSIDWIQSVIGSQPLAARF